MVKYLGETHKSIRERGGEHQRDARLGYDCHILHHMNSKYPRDNPKEIFCIDVIAKHDRPITREVSDAILIVNARSQANNNEQKMNIYQGRKRNITKAQSGVAARPSFVNLPIIQEECSTTQNNLEIFLQDVQV